MALACAYIDEAEVVMLDEPIAGRDARAEGEVFARLRGLSAGRTAALISRPFSSMRMADRILVLDGRRVEAVGTHAELLAEGGCYGDLLELQRARCR